MKVKKNKKIFENKLSPISNYLSNLIKQQSAFTNPSRKNLVLGKFNYESDSDSDTLALTLDTNLN